MAPPTQAGRFKPRKPAKRAAPTAIATPIAIPSAAAAAAAVAALQATASTDRGGGRGAGRGGRGRGGRGAPVIPQGQVFFTGTDKPAASSTRTSATAVAAASSKRKGKAAGMIVSSTTGGAKEVKSVALEVQEEVLNIDDEGIDALPDPAPRSSKLSSASTRQSNTSNNHESSNESQRAGGVASHDAPSDVLAYYYDSDSDEDDEPMPDYRNDSQLQPFLIDSARSDHITSNQAPHMSTSDENAHVQKVSPLLVQSEADATGHPLINDNSFFLVQLPTRLPPIISATRPDEVPKAPISGMDIGDEDPVPVSTPAVEVGSFDNQLTDAQPGRMGKIRVYQSGRTVFVWESTPGQAVVEMNVTEGLNCSFRQQAALIDLARKELTPLGNVRKTIVVSPELGDGYLA